MPAAERKKKAAARAAAEQEAKIQGDRIDPFLVLVLVAVFAAYANHFQNDFHFDDSHAVQSNPHITTLTNAGKFFTDASMFSSLPLNQSYRPLLTLSLAFD